MELLIGSAFIFLNIPVNFMKSVPNFMSQEFVDSINMNQSSWKAGRDYDIYRWYTAVRPPMSYLPRLRVMMTQSPRISVDARYYHSSELEDLPENFDARDHWPECKSLHHIRDQTGCGSCWAVSSASAMTDRLCIKSGGNITKSISAGDIISCAQDWSAGCDGGFAHGAWYYWKEHGIASGGDYGSNDGCVSYPFPSCKSVSWSKKPSCQIEYTPTCNRTCTSNDTSYADDLTYGKSVYSLSGEETIMKDILENGPVVGGFSVYEDFETYKSGIYHYVKGDFRYKHAVKMLGWGVENGEKYWLVANSWNEEWGDNGFFKIRRGTNECGIERRVYAGEPLL